MPAGAPGTASSLGAGASYYDFLIGFAPAR
jgi:hypothetical protein